MKKNAGLWKYLLSVVLLMSVFSTAALAFDVSGTVTPTSNGKRVYLSIQTQNGRFGTSIPSAPGSYTIRGVPAGSSYVVMAFSDELNTGSRHASDPYASSGIFDVTSAAVTGIDITTFKTTIPATVPAPNGLTVLPSDNSALVMWSGNNNGLSEQADKYGLFWSTSPDVVNTYASQGGSLVNIPATGDMRGLILTDLTTVSSGTPIANGATLYFAVSAKIGTNESAPVTLATPVTIGPAAGGYAVSGTVTFTGSTLGKPLLLAVVDSNQFGPPAQIYMTRIASPVSAQSYTISGIPNGTYRVYAFIDLNGNSLMDAGDLNVSDATAPVVTVANASVVNADVNLTSSLEALASVRTNRWKDSLNESYGLNYEIEGKYKRPVSVALLSGPNVTGPIDIALDGYGRFNSWTGIGSSVPQVGDLYTFEVTYSDSLSGNITASVNGVLSSYATPVSPVGATAFNAAPVLTWSAPVSPPAGFYGYQVSLEQQNGGGIFWDPKEMSSAATSVNFNFDGSASQTALTDNTAYNWKISVFDASGNSATQQASFTYGTPAGTSVAITTTGFTSPSVNTFFSQELFANGGSGSYTWSVESGPLPDGLTLSAGGVLSGTPTTVGVTNFTVRATDSLNASNFATMNYSFNVILTGTSLTVTTTSLPNAAVNSIYGQTISVTGGTAPYTFSLFSGTLPTGMTLNSTNGFLGGTPTVPGVYTFTVQAQDQIFATAYANLTLTVVGGSTTVSGTVSYSGSKTGRIYIYARTNNGLTVGTSISAPGAYSIQGVPAGSYTLSAFMDPPSLGAQVHNSPAGSVTFSTSSPSSINVTLTDPSTLVAGQPTNVGAAAGDASILMGWDGAKDSNGLKTADSYKVYWHTNSSVSKLNNLGSKTVPAELDSPVMISGLTNGTAYYFVVVPSADGVDGIASAVYGPVTIGAPVGGYTVSGTVNYTGAFSAGGVMYVVIVKPDSKGVGAAYYTKIASPAATNSFTVSGVPDGTYEVFALYDRNNDGLFAIGDIMPKDESAPLITVAGSAVSAGTISLVSANADVTITTQHGKQADNSSEWYNVNGNFRGQLLRPVAVKLTNAPSSSGITTPVDIGLDGREIRFWSNVTNPPVVGDVYTFTVNFADGSSQEFSPTVTGVLGNNSFATNPTVTGSSTVPTFSWAAPATPPANYKFSIWVGINNSNYWDAWALPSTQTSAVYGFDGSASSLQINTQYNWNISVRDLNGNEASVNGSYTPTVASVSLSGKVTDGSGVAIPSAFVYIYNASTNQSVTSVTTDSVGNYSVTGLQTGSYKIGFLATGYITQYYNNKATLALSDPVAVVLGTPATNVNATLILGGIISGTVSNGSTPIPNVNITAYDAVTGAYVQFASSDSSGNYQIQGLPAGSYKLKFVDFSLGYIKQWYIGKSSLASADAVAVSVGAVTSAINVVMTQGGSIASKVVNSTGIGVTGFYAYAYDAVTGVYDPDVAVNPDANGNFTLKGLPTGSYKVYISPFTNSGYVAQWYNNKLSLATADPVSVTVGATTTLANITLLTGGKITGTVTNSSGTPLSGINVAAFDAVTNIGPASVTTDTSGNYTISGLQTGNYKLLFNNTNVTNGTNSYAAVWTNNKLSRALADSVAVTAGATTNGINAVLSTGGTISGQITDGTNGIAGIYVYAYNALDEGVSMALTNASGNYTVKGLPNGSYKLRFQEQNNANGYVIQMYSNPNINTVYMSQGTLIPVTATTPVTGINAVMVKSAGAISGTVTDPVKGDYISGAQVRVFDLNDGYFGTVITDVSGNYTVKGLPTGSYKVEFMYPGIFAQQWYSAKTDFAMATTVSVTAPAATTSINAALGSGPSIFLPTVIRGYGNVDVATTATRTFQINSSGSADLTVGTLSTTGAGFTLLNDRCSGSTLPKNSYCTFQVSFTPTAAGAASATVNIPSNDPDTATIGITVKGTGVSNDTTPPVIVSINPLNNATNIPINTALSVKFNEAIDQTTLPVETAFLKTAAGVYIAGVGSYDSATNTGTFTPLTPLAYNTIYTGTFSGIKDLSGNVLATAYTFTFTTGANPDATAPSVIQSVPQNNAQNVSVDSALTVKFSEPVKAATVQSALTLRAGSAVVSGSVAYDSATNTASFTPAAPLAMGTTYSLSVGNAIEDLAGNKLNSLTIFFATEVPTGDIDGLNGVDIADAYKLLEIAVGNAVATTQDLKRGDIAPLVNGKPKPDGVIDVADVVVMLRRIVGLVTW